MFGFTEEEVNKYIEFLNHITEHAVFNNRSTRDQIKYVQLLNFQQTVILKKLQDAIAGEPKVTYPKKEKKSKS